MSKYAHDLDVEPTRMYTGSMGRWSVKIAWVVTLAAVVLGQQPASRATDAVAVPDVDGPLSGGVRAGRPWYASTSDPASYGYVETEFVVSGHVGPEDAAYTTRLHVIRPAIPTNFNGTIAVEWANVSSGFDTYPVWATSSDHLVREGFAYVAISVQKDGVDALTTWDPVRYGTLVHPGDVFALEIFSQAATALIQQRAGDPDPMGALDVRHLIATGASQSGLYLRRYLTTAHSVTQRFDGYVPVVVGGAFPVDVAPTIVVMSERDRVQPPPDGDLFVAWQVAGAPHVGYREASHDLAALGRDLTAVGGISVPVPFDRDAADQYGERGGSACPGNFMPIGYVYSAAISRMREWIEHGHRPRSATRLVRNGTTLQRDEYGNAMGGVRLPPVQVPIATYNGERCDIWGDTVALDPVTLARLYPTGSEYVAKMRAATEAAVADGFMMRADADAMMSRAAGSAIGNRNNL